VEGVKLSINVDSATWLDVSLMPLLSRAGSGTAALARVDIPMPAGVQDGREG